MKHVSLFLLTLSLAVFPAKAQTNAPPLNIPGISFDWLTNIPSASSFDTAIGSFNIGVLTRNGAVENAIKADFYVHTNYMFSGEAQISPASSVFNAVSLFGGYRKTWTAADIYVQGLIRRTWSTDSAGTKPCFQGGINLGATWVPTTGGTWCLGVENRLLTSPTGSVLSRPVTYEGVLFFGKKF